jgi:hypothetical protein
MGKVSDCKVCCDCRRGRDRSPFRCHFARDSTVVAAIASNTLCCYLNPVAVSDVESNVQGHV